MLRTIDPLTLSSLGYTAAKELTSVGRVGTAMSQFGWNATYDAMSRLDTWTRTGFTTPNEDYALDAAGNWNELKLNGTVSQTRTHFTGSGAPGKNQIVTLNGNAFTHDARGNMTQNDQGDTFTYDILNQLKSSNVIVGSNNPVSTYKYDALGRRIRQTVVDGSSTVLDKIYFYGPDFKLLESADITTATSSSFVISTSSFITVVWGRSFNELVWTSADGYLHGDQINSVIGNSNSSGTVSKLLTYTPYGQRSEWTLSGTTLTAATFAIGEMNFGYSSELRDPSGLIYYGYRFYSTELGRWINRDPIGENGGVNLYEMVESEPSIFADYLGLKLIYDGMKEGPGKDRPKDMPSHWTGSTGITAKVQKYNNDNIEFIDPSPRGENVVVKECENENAKMTQRTYTVYLKKSVEFDVTISSFVVNDLLDKPGGYTVNGYAAIKAHEQRRVDVWKTAYDVWLKEFEIIASIKDCKQTGMTSTSANKYKKAIEQNLLDRQREAKSQFLKWATDQQKLITAENRTSKKVPSKSDPNVLIDDSIGKIHTFTKPQGLPAFECPKLSD